MLHPLFFQYHTRNPMILMGGQRRPPETEIVSSLDSFLNQWLQSVPEHRNF